MKIKGNNKINKKNTLSYVFINIIIGIFYSVAFKNVSSPFLSFFINVSYYIIYLAIFSSIMGEMDRSFSIVMLMSIIFSLTAFSISSIIVFLITRLNLFENIIDGVMEYLLIGFFEILLICNFFRIKRFKNGFSFIKEEYLSRNIGIIGIILCIICMIFTIFIIYNDNILGTFFFARNSVWNNIDLNLY